MTISSKKLTLCAMLSAMSFLLMLFSKIIPEVSGFLQLDIKDVPVVIGGFLLGPAYTLLITAVVTSLEFISVSNTGAIGLLMNFISTGVFCFTASFIYDRFQRKSVVKALIGLTAATIMMTVVMLLWNYYITPMYMKIPREVVVSMLPTVFLPFNLIKGFINTGLIMLIYRPMESAFKAMHMVSDNGYVSRGRIFVSVVVGAALLVVFIPLFMLMM